MSTNDEHQVAFPRMLAQYVALLEQAVHAPAPPVQDDGLPGPGAEWEELTACIRERRVDKYQFVASISAMLSTTTAWMVRHALLKLIDEYSFYVGIVPELFWAIIKSEVLFDLSDVSDIGFVSRLLLSLGDAALYRAYLIESLLTEGPARRASLVKAFYPVGHTVETLLLVESLLGPEDLSLLLILYLHAQLELGPSDRPLRFDASELDSLRSFFRRGLTLPEPAIQEAAKRALARLGQG